jgi:hypothetical protein
MNSVCSGDPICTGLAHSPANQAVSVPYQRLAMLLGAAPVRRDPGAFDQCHSQCCSRNAAACTNSSITQRHFLIFDRFVFILISHFDESQSLPSLFRKIESSACDGRPC